MLFAIHLTAPAATAQTIVASTGGTSATDCQLIVSDAEVAVQSCDPGAADQRWMRLVVSGRNATVVNAVFSQNQIIWDRVWISEGSGQLSKTVQRILQRWVVNPSPELKASGFSPLLDVLGNFLEPQTRLENFDRKSAVSDRFKVGAHDHNWGLHPLTNWTPICEAIGTVRLATFFLNGDDLRVPQLISLPVGEPATDCRGRCGWGCAQKNFQVRHNQYTQECFNHDACHWTYHQQFGVCADAFWAAAASYVFAPDCPTAPTIP